ncbi:twin-arginine translocase subunit TatC [Agrobacterium sp. El2ro-1b]|uniref:twin-arginine translocase subunit TatC n=1 Tax=Agrobacterium sp. El2ro-1b TaxID=2969528 RepID=UPI003AAFE869
MSGDTEDKPQPLIEHLMELRTRLIWSLGAFFIAFIACFAVAKHLFNLLVLPYKWAIGWAGLDVSKSGLIYTAPQELLFTEIKVAMFSALVISFPVIASQLYKFIAPGLYKNERAAFLPFLIASPILFLIGAALVYFMFIPMMMWFFIGMQRLPETGEVAISLVPRVSEYLSLIMTLVMSFGLVFQLPVVTTLLARVGLLTSDWLREKRKFAIVMAFVVAAVLTPPDPMSQIGLALPAIILYEISIYMARLVERKRAAESKSTELEET